MSVIHLLSFIEWLSAGATPPGCMQHAIDGANNVTPLNPERAVGNSQRLREGGRGVTGGSDVSGVSNHSCECRDLNLAHAHPCPAINSFSSYKSSVPSGYTTAALLPRENLVFLFFFKAYMVLGKTPSSTNDSLIINIFPLSTHYFLIINPQAEVISTASTTIPFHA
ncbi:hypothetical protein V8F20_009166 [Naviculisporaceae sp. PSN 640]